MKLKLSILIILCLLIISIPGKISQVQAQSSMIRLVVCNNVSLYSRPSMRNRSRIRLQRGQKVELIGSSNRRGRNSFDFGKINYKGRCYYIPLEYVSKLPPAQLYDRKGNLIIGTEEVDKWVTLPLSYVPNDLVTVAKKYRSPNYKGRHMQLRSEAYAAFKRMMDDAARNGIVLRFVSCFRSAGYQEGPYKRNMRRSPKQKASAKPGHSEHQLGTV